MGSEDFMGSATKRWESNKKLYLSVVTPCFNEEENLPELFNRIRKVLDPLDLEYEHIVIDNASTDKSREIILEACQRDKRIKAIFNLKNYGHIRSPFHGLLQASGDCVIGLASDLQEPPELIPELLAQWCNGAKVVLLTRKSADERGVKQLARRAYYRTLKLISSHEVVLGATGAGLYDKRAIDYLRSIDDPYPFLRGLVTEAGFPIETVTFHQPLRTAGQSKNQFLTLYDIAMLGFTTSSRLPLRAVSFIGYFIGALSLLTAAYYLVRKLLSWDSFELGLAPLATGLFFVGAIQVISLGIIGEYIGNIFVRQRRLPLVIEERRVNFVADDISPKYDH